VRYRRTLKKAMIVLNYLNFKGGDLMVYMKGNKLNKTLIIKWFTQIIDALDYLHNLQNCMHRDMKSQ
jgi:serine/threonine protein kinase